MQLVVQSPKIAWVAVVLSGLATFSFAGLSENGESALEFEARIGKHGKPLVVDVQLANGRMVQFLLDTGAATTAFDVSLRNIAGCRKDILRFQTPNGAIQLDTYPCPQAKVGSLDLQPVGDVVFLDLKSVRAATGYDIQGVLGMDFLRRFAIEVDFDEGILRMWTSAPAAWEYEHPIPLINHRGVPHVECSLPGGRRELFVIDTGSNSSTVSASIFEELGAKGSIKVLAASTSATAGGCARNSVGIASSFELPPYVHRNVRIDQSTLSHLGLPYLSRYHLRLDLPRQRAFFQPASRFNVVDSTATSGMAVIHSNGKRVVATVEPTGAAQQGGIQPGDIIESVNDESAANLEMHDLRQLFTSAAGTELELKVLRNDRPFSTKLILQARTTANSVSK